MKMSKRTKLLAAGVALILLVVYLTYPNKSADSDCEPKPQSLGELVAGTETIVEVVLTGVEEVENKKIHQRKKKMDVEVVDVIRGDSDLKGRIIKLESMERLRAWYDPDQKRYVLFLEPRNSKAKEEDPYHVKGLSTGIMMLDAQGLLFWRKGDSVTPNSKMHFMDKELTGLTLEELRVKIDQLPSEEEGEVSTAFAVHCE